MVQGKKVNDMSNGTNKYQSSNMAFQRNNLEIHVQAAQARVMESLRMVSHECHECHMYADPNQAMPAFSYRYCDFRL